MRSEVYGIVENDYVRVIYIGVYICFGLGFTRILLLSEDLVARQSILSVFRIQGARRDQTYETLPGK